MRFGLFSNKYIAIIYLIALLQPLLFLAGCSTKHPPLQTVPKVDIERYAGVWFEIARFDHSFEKDCKNVSATYKLRADNKIDVINRCTLMNASTPKEAKGVAYAVDTTNSKLRVSFFWPFYGDYWVLMLDENYQYALVGAPSREYLWILSRTKTIDEKIKELILSKLPELGFDKSKFMWTIQE